MSDEVTAELVRRVRAGDENAKTELYARYADSVLLMLRGRFSEKLARVTDPEDALQSAYKDLFWAIDNGRYTDLPSGQLRLVLIGIAKHKVVRYARAIKSQETHLGTLQAQGAADILAGRGPSPEEAAEVGQTLEKALQEQDSRGQAIIASRFFKNRSEAEVAREVGLSERSVRRVCGDFKNRLEQLLLPD